MGTLWPDLPVMPSRCRRCSKVTARERMVHGYGRDCAERLGLIAAKRTRATAQNGTDLFDLIDDEAEDHCDGHDR